MREENFRLHVEKVVTVTTITYKVAPMQSVAVRNEPDVKTTRRNILIK